MRITVTHTLHDLAADAAQVPPRAYAEMVHIAAENARTGRDLAKLFARESAGAHGKHYHKAITAEAIGPLEWEYGPDAGYPQGGMSFEYGSRNQPPHLDLARSADIIAAEIGDDVQAMFGRLFW
jgi:hypothetical protein